jgi:hypothetical protein
VEDAVVQLDDGSREALPAEAPETSVLELELRALLDELPGDEALDSLDGPDAELLLLGPALAPADGELWASAPVATPAAARAAAAHRVVMVRIWESSFAPQLAQQLAGARSVHPGRETSPPGRTRKMPYLSTS